jgi:hypothetical protein
MSLRSFCKIGSSVSIMGKLACGSIRSTSIINFTTLGSALSVRSSVRLSSKCSALNLV